MKLDLERVYCYSGGNKPSECISHSFKIKKQEYHRVFRHILCLKTSTIYTPNNLPRYYEKPEAARAVLGS
jgi:hypothetical protein